MGFESILGKFWLRSRTIVFNLLVILAGVWTMVEGQVPFLKDALGPKWYGITLFAVGMAGIGLRMATKSPLRAVSEEKALERYVSRSR
ncbi:hypothetical protein [Flavobacterium sp.]|jgi:hypothetical protein|uniref:hypothetical protein n=1 Tax=Flavobacterium sp. TaxID=239 RepID=UPI0037C05BB1